MELFTFPILLLSTLFIILFYLYNYFTKYFDFFKQQGIPFIKPVPIFGSWWGVWNTREFHLVEKENCKKYNGNTYGMYHGRTPCIIVSDPELIRRIFVKDFDHFVNRGIFKINHEYIDKGVGFLHDGEWKEMRSLWTPAFTTGKIKNMVALMNEPGESLVKHLKLQSKKKKIDIRPTMSAFVIDVMATCGFGVKIDSLQQPDNPFLTNGLKAFFVEPHVQASIPFILAYLYPDVTKHLMPASFNSGLNFFVDVARNVLKERRNQPASTPKRHDFVDFILEGVETNQVLKSDEKAVIAQLLLFIIAGFDTTAFSTSMTLHCLAMNTKIQDKVREELLTTMKKHNGEINYDVIRELPYMDQCISEVMRLYPAGSRLDRLCTKDIDFGEFKLKKGMFVVVPAYSIHMDPKHYPNPEIFDPERFSTEQKAQRDPNLYLPFGSGNRSCVGKRFGLDNIKIGLCHLLSNFKFVPAPETINPPKVESGIVGVLQNKECILAIECLS